MPYLHILIKRAIKKCYWLLLFIVTPCYAQLAKVNELQQRLKQPLEDTVRLTVLKQLSLAYSSVDPEKKFYYANVYKNLAEKLNNHEAVADAYINMGVSYGLRSKADSALYYFIIAYNRAEKINYELGMARSLSNIGYAYDRLDSKQESIKNYLQALNIFKKIDYARGINQTLTNIGSLYFDLNQYKLAESYFAQCLANATANKDTAGIGYALYTLGNSYQAMGQNKKALTYLTKSLTIRQQLDDRPGIALVRRAIGLAYYNQKQYDKALTNFNIALSATRELKQAYEQGATLDEIAKVYIALHDYNKAKVAANECLAIGREIKSKIMESAGLNRLIAVYKGENNIAKAFQYQSEYIATQDSISTEKILNDITLTEISRMRAENAELAKDNKVISTENSNYLTHLNQYANLLVIVFITLCSVILLLLIQYRRNMDKQAANKVLQKQKEEITTINKELQTLNEEVTTQMELTHSQNIELEHLNGVKNKFFSIISHDLRSPISNLQSLFSVYREGVVDKSEFSMLLAKLEDTIISTGNFLDNLLEWSKNQLEGIKINPVDFDVNECVAENIRLFESKIIMKGLKVTNHIIPPAMVHADKDMINLVVRNLFSNSVKFCNPGDEIKFESHTDEGKVIIAIHDTGPGISQGDREKLFSLEHSLSTGTQGEKGNHLGLILCKDMVTQNNGDIWFDTNRDKGTTFCIALPVSKQQLIEG
ncbi:tetratricopeptide repeat-containing sensor histidine kinase [Mucilaginibacter segetis]|uniref:histidine kinase n=1 Tax=Mucilaginibacter segetis TaxID=2793071 RepID=A0A934UNE9_9SPHI|nr:tetratricopeptide repeat protein [Mucilaginibacter segetis]MBK0380349.1 tetratricopeptide repeat-containing sensor histidine kinase [Mucilaginibacter segetis]